MTTIVLVRNTSSVDLREVRRVTKALQKQVSSDVASVWERARDVVLEIFDAPSSSYIDHEGASDPATWPEVLGPDVWPIFLLSKSPLKGFGGLHQAATVPYGFVATDGPWSVRASHEAIEMLVNPWGKESVMGLVPGAGDSRVACLVQACDPCQKFTYKVESVDVSDFVLPSYFDETSAPGARLDWLRKISRPFEILGGGYLSWSRSDNVMWQTFSTRSGVVVRPALG